MDKFGYIRGRRGPVGPPGKDAFNLYAWCPSALLQLFRESESCTYFFNTADDGVIESKSKALKDRYGKNNAICLKNFEKPRKYQDIFILPLQGALYRVDGIQQALFPPSIVVFAFTFKIAKPLTGEHYIFTNQNKTRGVYISETLNICGADPVLLEYEKRDWNRVIVQYSRFDFGGRCFFILNGRRGFFDKKDEEEMEHALFLGGHPDEKRSADVYISNFEIYSKSYDMKTEPNYILPEEISNLIDKDYVDRVS